MKKCQIWIICNILQIFSRSFAADAVQKPMAPIDQLKKLLPSLRRLGPCQKNCPSYLGIWNDLNDVDKLYSDEDFKVQLKNKKIPEIWFKGKWSPICGHNFWENNYGASLFCQKLNTSYTSGKVIRRFFKNFCQSDGIRVGGCTRLDNSLSSCTYPGTVGCNDLKVGGHGSNNSKISNCGRGPAYTHEIECFSGCIVFIQLKYFFLLIFNTF